MSDLNPRRTRPETLGLRAVGALHGLALATAAACLAVRPDRAALPVLVSLLVAGLPVARAWRRAWGTALRPAIVWVGISLTLGVIGQGLATSEPLSSGRPAAGHLTYLTTLAALAASITVLNARRPGGGAWAILNALLVLVFLIPWLEGAGLSRDWGLRRLRLDDPWTLFYGLLVLAGVTNFLPTRYGPAALLAGLGFGLEYLGLTRHGLPNEAKSLVWSAVPLAFSAAVWVASVRNPDRGGRPPLPLDQTWLWFRDLWGVVWALRVMERFNRTAAAQRWGFRLGWQGLVADDPTRPPAEAHLAAAGQTLRVLIRRFAEPWRPPGPESEGSASCQSPGVG